MKKMLQILFVLLTLSTGPVHPSACEKLNRFDGEILKYSMKFKGVNSANSILESDVENSRLHIKWSVKTRSLFKWLFFINNEYNSFINIRDCLLLSVNKSIDQKNITQEFKIQYDWDKKQAIPNFTAAWKIPNGCVDILTMLYLIRTLDKDEIEQTHFLIDVESQIWNVSLEIIQPDKKTSSANPNFDSIKALFLPFGEIKKRKWKTDLLTNRIARPEGQMIIVLGPFPQREPVLLIFGDSNSRVEMRLKKTSSKIKN
jgi:hypothetical protein